MPFDFKQTYKSYSNVQLLLITLQPAKYQPEALNAAAVLLKERAVTEEDHAAAQKMLQASDMETKFRQEQQEAIKKKATDFLEPILHPGKEVKLEKWLPILLLILIAQYLWSAYNAIKFIIYTIEYDNELLPWEYFGFVDLVLTPVIIYLLYRRRKWGWILLFGISLFVVISHILQSTSFYAYWRTGADTDILSFLWPLFIHSALCLFLWRKDTATFFGVTDSIKKKVAIIVLSITLLYFVLLTLLVS